MEGPTLKTKKRKHLIKKINKYIIRDHFQRLKEFLRENDVHPDSRIGRHERTGLHECAKNGSIDCIRILLEYNADPHLKDKKGNYPLHLAIKYLLKQKTLNSLMVNDLIGPLKQQMYDRIHDENISGTTCWHLLQGLNLKAKVSKKQETSDSSSSSESNAESDVKDIDWNEKLMQIHEEDHYFDSGKYDNSEIFQNKYKETYDQWADRIFNEFNKRKQRSFKPDVKKKEAKNEFSEFQKAELPQFKPSYPSNNSNKTAEYNALFVKAGKINKHDMPFTQNSSAEQILSLIIDCDEQVDKRKAVREAIRKWHPDKFSQMFSERIEKNDLNEIMNIVTHVSQTLLNYGK